MKDGFDEGRKVECSKKEERNAELFEDICC